MSDVISAKGADGSVTFDGQMVVITRPKRLSKTFNTAEQRLPLSSITSVQWKEASWVGNGAVTFTVAGVDPDDNKVIFRRGGAADDFAALRDAVEQAIAGRA